MSRVPLATLEVLVVRLVVEGLKDDEISARVGIGLPEMFRTVSSLYRGLGVSDRLELVIHAYHHGIVPPPHQHSAGAAA